MGGTRFHSDVAVSFLATIPKKIELDKFESPSGSHEILNASDMMRVVSSRFMSAGDHMCSCIWLSGVGLSTCNCAAQVRHLYGGSLAALRSRYCPLVCSKFE